MKTIEEYREDHKALAERQNELVRKKQHTKPFEKWCDADIYTEEYLWLTEQIIALSGIIRGLARIDYESYLNNNNKTEETI
jgi:hypothetical protein